MPLVLYGPRGLEALYRTLQPIIGRLTFEVAVVELAADASLPRAGYELRTFPVVHGAVALGYALVEEERPGRFDVAIADSLGVPAGRSAARCRTGRR